MDLTNLRNINEQKAQDAVKQERHTELLLESTKTQEAIVKSFEALVKYLNGHITKTEVINQIDEVRTPDVRYVIEALNGLHETLKTHENTDLSEITSVMREVLDETKKLPKDKVDITIPEQKDYVAQFKSLETAIKAVEKVVKQQKLIAEAPIVNVPETVVNVDKPDLKPLQKNIAEVVTAVSQIVIPELDTSELEKLLKKSNKLLNEILQKPVSSGGGGGGRATPYEDSNGIPHFVVVEADGSIPVTVKADESGSGGKATSAYGYQAEANDGTYTYYFFENATPDYYLMRETDATGQISYAKGTGSYTGVYVNNTSAPSGSPSWGTYGAIF